MDDRRQDTAEKLGRILERLDALEKAQEKWQKATDEKIDGITKLFTKAEGALMFVKIIAAVAVAGAGFWAWVSANIFSASKL